MLIPDDAIVIALGKGDDFVHAGRADLLTAHGRSWTSGESARLDFFDPDGHCVRPVFGGGGLTGFGPDRSQPAEPKAVLARIGVVLEAGRALWEGEAPPPADPGQPTPFPPGQVVPDFVDDLDEMARRIAHACGLVATLEMPSDNGGWFHNLMHRLRGDS